MANWDILKKAISDAVKTNGNQEITGQLLQQVLLNIVTNVGANATFAGIATPATNPGTQDGPVFYLATKSGTYVNFNNIEVSENAVILLWNNGTWQKKLTGFATSDDITGINGKLSGLEGNLVKALKSINVKYGEKDYVVLETEKIGGNIGTITIPGASADTAGVMTADHVKELSELELKTDQRGIYDVSAHNNGAVFESLSALLNHANLSTLIPVSVRYGGMSIRFIQGSVPNSDNKYVQYRLIATAWSTNESDWQGVEEMPTVGSNNIVKSSGIAERIYSTESKIGDIDYRFNVKKRGEHSSNLDRVNISIPAGSYLSITLTNITANSTGYAGIYVHYVGDSQTTIVGHVSIGGDAFGFTAKNDIDSIGFYMVSAELGIMGGKIKYDVNKDTGYIPCNSESSDEVKTCKIKGFKLSTHARVLIRMRYKNTHSSPKLNISGTGAHSIYYNGSIASDVNTWQSGELLDVYVDDASTYITTTHSELSQTLEGSSRTKVVSQYALAETFNKRLHGYDFNNFIIGKGAILADTKVYGLRKGVKYVLHLQDINKLTDTVEETDKLKFSIAYQTGENNIRSLVDFFVGDTITTDTYEITIGNDFYDNGYLKVGGRAVDGTIVNFSIKEATLSESDLTTVSVYSTAPEIYSDNVFNAETATQGKAINQYGTIVGTDCIVSDYILCAGKEYISTNYGGRDSIYHAFYNYNKQLINTVSSKDKAYQIPANAAFVRFTLSAYTSKNYVAFVNSTSLTYDDYVPFQIMKQKVQQIDNKVQQIDNKVQQIDNTNVYSYNKDKIPAIVSAVSRNPLVYEKNNSSLCFAFSVLTDLHSDIARFERACKFADDVSEITATLCLGDMINTSNTTNPYPLILNYNKAIIPITGNHEVLKKSAASITGWDEAALLSNMYSSDLVAHNGETHPEGKCYWYKDFTKTIDGTAKKLRVIGLHQYESNGTGNQNTGSGKDVTFYSQSQIDWLIERLDECDVNTMVMILVHFAPTNAMTKIDGSFNPSDRFNFPISGGSNTGGSNSMSDNLFLPKIIQAWIDGTTLDISCNITVGETVTTITAVKSTAFAAHDKQFAGWFTGHTHRDLVCKITNYPKQMVFSFICSSATSGQNSCDVGRSTTKKSQDCFTIVGIDWFTKAVNLIRIGADVTTDMRERKFANFMLT